MTRCLTGDTYVSAVDEQTDAMTAAVARAERSETLTDAARSRPRGLWWDAWRRLRRNTAALMGAAYILFMLALAVAAPLLAPHDPLDHRELVLQPDPVIDEHPVNATDTIERLRHRRQPVRVPPQQDLR